MKANCFRRIFLFTAILTILITRRVNAAEPVVHLLAPNDKAIDRFDPLIAETALRLVSVELAARHNVYANYWSVDQLNSIPADAYPRLTISYADMGPMRYLRLRREGAKLTTYVSPDGEDYYIHSEYQCPYPEKVWAGIYVPVLHDQRPFQANIKEMELNGQSFTPSYIGDLGPVFGNSETTMHNKGWIVRTNGVQPVQQHDGAGCYLLRDCVGDFDLRMTAPEVFDNSVYACTGVVCLADKTCSGGTTGIFSFKSGAYSGVFEKDANEYQMNERLGMHRAEIILETAPDLSRVIAFEVVDCRTWDLLRSSIERLANRIEAAMSYELKIELPPPAEAIAPTEAQAAILDQARALALNVTCRQAVKAADMVDSVLDESPACPEAHLAATTCSVVPALHDLYGNFHERGRYLAVPFSHWLAGERMSPTPVKNTAGAWLMLAAGYPKRALASMEGLPEDKANTPEVKALKMFATRDYRALSEEDVKLATPIEQLAWIWATQDCGREDILDDMPQYLAVQNSSSAFLPAVIKNAGVGPGHATTAMGVAFSLAEDTEMMMLSKEIEPSRRTVLARRAAKQLGIPVYPDMASYETYFKESIAELDEPRDITKAVAAVEAFRREAISLPAGPVMLEESFRWRCLPLHELAKLRQGWMVAMLDIRCDFIGNSWGVSEEADKFSRKVSAGFEPDSFLSAFFMASGLLHLEKKDQVKEVMRPVVDQPVARTPAARYAILEDWGRSVLSGMEFRRGCYPDGRGLWDWIKVARIEYGRDNRFAARAACWDCLREDDYCTDATKTLVYYAANTALGDELIKRMPYNQGLLAYLGQFASTHEKVNEAIAIYEKMLEQAPRDVDGYRRLSYKYIELGERLKAIEVVKTAASKCDDSVQLSNLIGWMSQWLIWEGRLEEGLEWGERAAESYSAVGLKSLAIAQEANGMIPEARATLLAVAERYEGCADDLVLFLLRHGTEEQTIAEVRKLLKVHSAITEPVKKGFGYALIRGGGSLEMLEKGLKEGLLTLSGEDKDLSRIVCAMNSRDFKAVKECYEKSGTNNAFPVIMAFASAQLSGDRNFQKKVQKDMETWLGDKRYGALMAYQLGKLSYDDALSVRNAWYHVVMANWIKGAKAEANGDTAAALAAYRAATSLEDSSIFVGMAVRAARRLEEAHAKATDSTNAPLP